MTEHDIDDVRTLFHDAQPAEVPVTRDLIGPAVAWGSARRRRDRIVVGATVGTLAIAALTALTLRPEEKEVYLLRQNASLTYEEIARQRHAPVGTVKTQMRAAIAKLRRALHEK